LLFNRCGESIIDNIDIIFDELKRKDIDIDIDKQSLSFHINTILDRHRDLYRAVNSHGLNLDQIYREINVTNFGCIIAYLAFVCLQNDSEESIRHDVQKTIEACRIFNIPKHKPSKRPILITLSLTLIALYISLLLLPVSFCSNL
jgi:hypothetical protein